MTEQFINSFADKSPTLAFAALVLWRGWPAAERLVTYAVTTLTKAIDNVITEHREDIADLRADREADRLARFEVAKSVTALTARIERCTPIAE